MPICAFRISKCHICNVLKTALGMELKRSGSEGEIEDRTGGLLNFCAVQATRGLKIYLHLSSKLIKTIHLKFLG